MRPTLLARIAAIGYFVTMGLHVYAFAQIMIVAKAGPGHLSDLVSVLWLAFSVALLVLGAIVWASAPAGTPRRRVTLLLVAVFPLAGAVLQVVFMGLIAPEAILGTVGALTVAAALVPDRPRSA